VTTVLLLLPAALYGWSWLVHRTRTTDTELRHPVSSVRLDVPSGSVVVRPGPDGQVRLHATRSWSLREPRIEQQWDGSALTLRLTDPGPALDGLAPSVALELQVPATVSVDASVPSGSVDLAGLQGDLHVQTTDGSVTVADARGRLRLRSTSGEIKATGLRSPAVDAQADSGTVGLEFSAPPERVAASVGSGELRITVPPNSRYRVSGSARVAEGLDDAQASRTIDVQTGAGSASLGY
jgi:hypothetical protein